jgi:4-deoxy-L-threo-5-hexosulose-uronate ketol-isomerase
MEIRNAIHPRDFKTYTTEAIRKEFLVQHLFTPGQTKLVYSHYDRMIVGGVCPNKPLALKASKEIGAEYFLAGREMGVINVASKGTVTEDDGWLSF